MGATPKALLIGTTTYWIPENYSVNGLDIWPGDFGLSTKNSRRCEGSHSLPNPVEFDVIVSDFGNVGRNAEFERRLAMGDEYVWRPALVSVNGNAVADAYRRRDFFEEAFRTGRLLILIAGPVWSEGQHSCVGWWPLSPMAASLTALNEHGGPAPCMWSTGVGAFEALVQDFGLDFTWEMAFDVREGNLSPPRMPGGPFQWISRRPDPDEPQTKIETLAKNTSGRAVAFRVLRGAGEILVLPNIRDDRRRAELVEYLFTTFLRRYRPHLAPSYWVSSYRPNCLSERARQIAEEEERVMARLAEVKQEFALLEERTSKYRALVHTKSEELKKAVNRSFTEVLGLRVTDMDEVQDDNPKVFDLLVEGNGFTFAVEVRGKENRSLTGDDIDKLLKNLEKYGGRGQLRPVLVLNPAFEYPPSSPKRCFSLEQVRYAERHGVAVLHTEVLFEVVARVIMGRISVGAFLQRMSRPGQVEID